MDLNVENYLFTQSKITEEYITQIKYLTEFIKVNEKHIPQEETQKIVGKLATSNGVMTKLLGRLKEIESNI